jgi:hypothetical protein
MDSLDQMRIILSQLARQDATHSINLCAPAGTEEAFGIPGLSPDEIHKSLRDGLADGLIRGEPFEGDGSMRTWFSPQLTVRGLAWLGMWPSDERPIRDAHWWDRALLVLRQLHETPPANGVLLKPLGTNGPSAQLPGADERTHWMVVEYLREGGMIRGESEQSGLSAVAVTPRGEEALRGGRTGGSPALTPLTRAQRDLFMQLSEIAAGLPAAEREFHHGKDEADGRDYITASGGLRIPAIWNDVSKIEDAGLVEWTETNYVYGYKFALTRKGENAFAEALRDSADRFNAIERDVTGYLRGDLIAARYPKTYKRWLRAEQQLVSGKSEDLTIVGHTAREVLQIFGTELVELHTPVGAPPDPTKTVARVRAVLDLHKQTLGATRTELLDALLTYWGTVSDLAQRLEHAAQKEGEPISREDARQLVYLTAQVVFEIDRSLPAPPSI